MKKYVLVSAVELEIYHKIFDSFEDAQAAMRNEFKTSADEVEEKIEDGEANIFDNNAWMCDGYNHDNFSWSIIEVEV